MNVTKRSGQLEPLNISKIQRAAQWACEGLDVSQSELEVQAKLMFFEGIKTSDIQDALIRSAAALITLEKPDYTFTAARLLLLKLYKEIFGSINYAPIEDYLRLALIEQRISRDLVEKFDLEKINAAIKPERDFLFNYIGLQTIADRYLVRERAKAGKEGEIIEAPQHFWMRVAMGLAILEDNPTEAAIEFYDVLSQHEFVNSTPTLFNSGTLRAQMSSCYLNQVSDQIDADELDSENWETERFNSIFGLFQECANLSKFAGGIGSDWTPCRSAGDVIKGTNGQSSGVVPYLKIYNDTAVAVNQCFAPDTLVRVADGVKQIQDIKVGDLVLGLRGQYREVTNVMQYEQKVGGMVEINVKHSVEPIKVTDGHPVWAITGVPNEQSLARTLKGIEKGTYPQGWVEAGQLKAGDYVGQSIPTEVFPVEGFTEDDARLYGIMLGDGHCALKAMTDWEGKPVTSKEYGVTGESKDEDTIVFVADYLDKRGIKYGYSVVGNSACQIKWSYGGKQQERNSEGKFLKGENCLPFDHEDLYDANGKKRISARFSHLPLNQAIRIVQGLIDSDGCVSRGKELTFHNTSLGLAEGLRYQLLRMGIPTAGNKRERVNTSFGGTFTTVYDIRIPAFAELANLFGIDELTKFNWFKVGNTLFTRVKSVTPIENTSFVYDLKVDGDESYSTNAFTAHNGGKRNGSFAPYLEPWHPDFMDYIELKKNSGDDRRRAHDIFPAAWTPDLFMKRVNEKGAWSFFSPAEFPELHELYGDAFEARYTELEAQGKYRFQLPAFEVWRKWLTMLFETGHPWVTFKDESNRRSPQDHVGVVHSSNLCTEITLNTSKDETAVCNLGSLNLAVIKPENLRRVIRTAMRMLDNVIDINFYPSERAKRSNLRHRPIGLGVMGYTELLVKMGIDWESEEHIEFADELFEVISYYAIEASSDLAAVRGRYESFEGSKWSRGILPIDTARDQTQRLDWEALRQKVMRQGMRNSNTMAIAPTATISNIVGTTPCIEPIFKRYYTKKNLSGIFLVADPCMRYGRPELCKEAFEVDQKWVILSAAKRQKWIDQSQSINIFIKQGIKGSQLSDIYMLAWERGLKTTYYLRNQTTESEVTKVGEKKAEVAETNADVLESEVKMCSLDNPDCESCQ